MRRKSLVVLVVFLGLVLLEIGFTYHWLMWDFRTDSLYLAKTQVKNLQTYDYARVGESLASFAEGRRFSNILILNSYGQLVSEWNQKRHLNLPLVTSSGVQVGGGRIWLVFTEPIEDSQQELLGRVILRMSLWNAFKDIILLLAAFLGIGFAIFYFGSAMLRNLARATTEPVSKLSELLRGANVWPELKSLSLDSNIKELHHLLDAFREMADRLEKAEAERIKSAELAAVGRLASDISHDIRSPLCALNAAVAVIQEKGTVDDFTRNMTRSATLRINDIAKGLNQKSPPVLRPKGTEMVSGLIEGIVSEKRLLCRDRPEILIEEDYSFAYGLFANVDPSLFQRVISNLIDNSIKAMPKGGTISVRVTPWGQKVEIVVADTGEGIPEEVRPKLFVEGATFFKEGSGRGLFSAKRYVDSWGGSIQIKSEVGRGTEIRLLLPRDEIPVWFAPRFSFKEECTVFIVDDDASVHDLWESRFAAEEIKSKGLKLKHLYRPDFAEAKGNLGAFFIVDYDFGGISATGIDFIKNAGIAGRCYLVTSLYEETAIRQQCIALKTQLVPKEFSHLVPIEVAAWDAGFSCSCYPLCASPSPSLCT